MKIYLEIDEYHTVSVDFRKNPGHFLVIIVWLVAAGLISFGFTTAFLSL